MIVPSIAIITSPLLFETVQYFIQLYIVSLILLAHDIQVGSDTDLTIASYLVNSKYIILFSSYLTCPYATLSLSWSSTSPLTVEVTISS